jgi:uncharacterized protein (DUF1501 family)
MNNPVHSRRIFLQRSMALMSLGVAVPTFLDHTAWALDPSDSKALGQESGKDGKILVVVQMSGGNDGLNTVVPYADDAYQRARPAIGKKGAEVLKIDNYVGLHPDLTGFKSLYDEGMLSVIQGVGYPNPNRSHFRSMDIWHSGIPEKEMVTSGWLGRYFDNTCSGSDPHVGVCIGEQSPLAMKGDRVTPLSFERPENYRYNGKDPEHYKQLNSGDMGKAPATPPKGAKPTVLTPGSQLEFLTRTSMDAQVSSDKILDLIASYNATGDYPRNEFGNGLRTIAAMIRGNLPTRVYYVSMGGFDTHANQLNRHDQLMTQLSQGIGAFWKDMKDQKNEQRVLMMCFSEFGRRVEQNASGGTDHGAAAPTFLMGPSISKKAGLVGTHPSLTKLDQGDLMFSTDFRSIYATILEEWLKTPSKPILGQQFAKMPIFKA